MIKGLEGSGLRGPGVFVIITEGSGMGEHLFRAKQMHSRRKCIPT